MAATFTKAYSDFEYSVSGMHSRLKRVVGTLNLGNPVAAGGEAVTALLFDGNATSIVSIDPHGCSADGLTNFRLNAAGDKVQAFNEAGVEVTGDLSSTGKDVRVTAYLT